MLSSILKAIKLTNPWLIRMMKIMLNIFQRHVWSISAERCKQLCDWDCHPLHLNTEFSVLLSCFLIATCNIVHTSHACHHSLSEQIQQSIRFPSTFLTPQGFRFKQMQALFISQTLRVCKTYRGEGATANAASFYFPPSHALRMCACVSKDKKR